MALYHMAKGPVNYTVVGNPTITEGVVSGLGGNNYLSIGSITSANAKYEANIAFTTGSSTQSGAGLIGADYGVNGFFWGGPTSLFAVLLINNSLESIKVSPGVVGSSATNLIDNTKYYAKLIIENGFASIGISTDVNNIQMVDSGLTGVTVDTSNIVLGTRVGYVSLFGGSIDLDNTYIMVNNQPWFGNCPVEVKRHQIMGPVGYTVQGSATVNDGIATNFSYGSRLQLSQSTTYSSDGDWEFYFRFKTQAVFEASTRGILNIGMHPGSGLPVSVLSTYNNVLVFSNLPSTPLYGNAMNTDTWYKVKVTIKNGAYHFYHYTDDGTLLVEKTGENNEFSYSDTFNIGESFPNLSEGPLQIDLNQSYIKKDGSLWFYQPQETKYIIREDKLVWADPRIALSGPVNYSVVGSPTITDGVASRFSNSSYLQLNSTFNPGNNPWEMCYKVKVLRVGTSRYFAGRFINESYGLTIGFSDDNLLSLWVSGNGTSWDIINGLRSSREFSSNEEVWIKIGFTGSLYFMEYSLDGSTIYERKEVVSTSPIYSGSILLGKSYTAGYAYDGSIDLNETYIKVNDSLWFYGKNYASKNIAPVPSGFQVGSITTPSIGYIDMRTQTFYPAPDGATIGMD